MNATISDEILISQIQGRSSMRAILLVLFVGCFGIISIETKALSLGQLNIPDNAVVCYVQAGAEVGGRGSKKHPYHSLAEVEADPYCTVILVKIPKEKHLALDGGIFLKPGQKLFGLGRDVTKHGTGRKKLPLITNTSQENLVDALFGALSGNRGVGVILSQDNEVAGVHIDGTYNAGISAINVANSEVGAPGAIIHHVLITNAVTSGDSMIDDFGFFQESAAIEIATSPLPPTASPLGGPGGDAHIVISDSIIRDGIAGFSSTAGFPWNVTLSLDNVTVERMSPAYALERSQVFVLQALSEAAGHVITINDSRFYDIDNRIPAIFPRVRFDAGFMDVTVNNTILSNPSNLSSFWTLRDGSAGPRGDGFTLLLQGGTANIALTDFTIENMGQDAIEIESDFFAEYSPFSPAGPPFVVTRRSVATIDIKRAILRNNGLADLLPLILVAVPVPESGPASGADKQLWSVSDSTFEGSGALTDLWTQLLSIDALSAVGAAYADNSVEVTGLPSGRPLGNSDNLVFDLGGGELGSTGGNRFVNPIGTLFFKIEGFEELTVTAQHNWWGTPLGLDPAKVDNVSATGAKVDASFPLLKNPRRSKGKRKHKKAK